MSKQFFLQGFYHGFRVECKGQRKSFQCDNLKSAKERLPVLRSLLHKEIQKGWIKGPFKKEPIPNTRVSPLGLVPKRDDKGNISGWRKITHLSYPKKDGTSVNTRIDKHLASVQYQSFDDAVEMCHGLGQGAYLAKTDMKSAFRQLPIHKDDLNLLGCQVDGLWFLDVCMPFGLSIACKVFEEFSSAIHWRVTQLIGDKLVHYLDDFLLGARSKAKCSESLQVFRNVCTRVGMPIAEDKTVGPARKLSFLGLGLDTLKQCVGVPQHKIIKATKIVRSLLAAKVTTVRKLQVATGLLNFMSKAFIGV